MKAKVEYTCAFCHQHNEVPFFGDAGRLNNLSVELDELRTSCWGSAEIKQKVQKTKILNEIDGRCAKCRKYQAWSAKSSRNKAIIVGGIIGILEFVIWIAIMIAIGNSGSEGDVGLNLGCLLVLPLIALAVGLFKYFNNRFRGNNIMAIQQSVQDGTVPAEVLPALSVDDAGDALH